jgi:hypothetical protein
VPLFSDSRRPLGKALGLSKMIGSPLARHLAILAANVEPHLGHLSPVAATEIPYSALLRIPSAIRIEKNWHTIPAKARYDQISVNNSPGYFLFDGRAVRQLFGFGAIPSQRWNVRPIFPLASISVCMLRRPPTPVSSGQQFGGLLSLSCAFPSAYIGKYRYGGIGSHWLRLPKRSPKAGHKFLFHYRC